MSIRYLDFVSKKSQPRVPAQVFLKFDFAEADMAIRSQELERRSVIRSTDF
jgi:hypothetical protein